MTDLQMGLIGLGGVAVVGVLAYNKWQDGRGHQRVHHPAVEWDHEPFPDPGCRELSPTGKSESEVGMPGT
ncbi:MAG: hypothetical protein J0M31_23630, partial [Candidatus Accumulibacter sp.]|nr:hypothetical protein [Accumulibacter sp.]